MWASRPRDDARARSGGGLRGGGAGSLLIEIKVIILNRRVWFGRHVGFMTAMKVF
jgi:hypothetical protein